MNSTQIVESVTAEQLKGDSDYPVFGVGDTLNVHVRIIEGGKERVQIYQGVLIADKGRGINRMITVQPLRWRIGPVSIHVSPSALRH